MKRLVSFVLCFISLTCYAQEKTKSFFQTQQEKVKQVFRGDTKQNEDTQTVSREYKLTDLAPTKEGNAWGYKQFDEWVIRPRFEAAGDFEDGIAPVKLGGKWGFIDKTGKSVIQYKYDGASSFKMGLARVRQFGKWGFIDNAGNTVIPFWYDTAEDFQEGLASVSYGGKVGYIDKTGEWFDSKSDVMHSFSAYARHFVENDINEWQRKGKYEKLAQWQARVTETHRKARIDSLVNKAKEDFIAMESANVKQRQEIVDYDTESEVFLIHDKRFGNLLVPVPITEAEKFEKTFSSIRREDTYCVNGDKLGLAKAVFTEPSGKTYNYTNTASLSFAQVDIDYNFEAVSFEMEDNTQTGSQALASRTVSAGQSDVDVRIPATNSLNDKTFVLILSNEDYKFVSKVPYAKADGKTFEEYCLKTLGVPKDHIHRQENATLGTFMGEVDWITGVSRVYGGTARVIVYYAGHGIPDESSRDAFLLPVDGTGTNTNTAYKLSELYSRLSEYPTQSTVVFLDACFSGSQRNGQMLASARGVVIKAKTERPSGNLIVFSAASGDETAYPYREKGHGLFSYYLLKKLQESRGEATLGELAAYIKENVSRQSIVQNAKSQTPTFVPSPSFGESWKEMKLK